MARKPAAARGSPGNPTPPPPAPTETPAMFVSCVLAAATLPPTQPPPPAPTVTFGIGYAKDPATGQIRVTSTDPTGLAAQMGLRARDEIRSINGVRVTTEAGVRTELRRVTTGIRMEIARTG